MYKRQLQGRVKFPTGGDGYKPQSANAFAPNRLKDVYKRQLLALESDDIKKARELLTGAEDMGLATLPLYAALEQCYKELEDYKLAYHYAVLQKGS